MHIALDLSNELNEIALKNLKPAFKTIITTNFKDATNEQEA